MDRKVGYIIIALVAALLFFLAVGYHSWPCNDSILGPRCIRVARYETVGALLLTAGLIILLCAIFLILVVALDLDWSHIIATVCAVLAAILSLAGVLYYQDTTGQWCPFIATIGMSLTVALAAILLFDLIQERT